MTFVSLRNIGQYYQKRVLETRYCLHVFFHLLFSGVHISYSCGVCNGHFSQRQSSHVYVQHDLRLQYSL